MQELIRTNDPVLISYIRALLSEANIAFMVADTNMSVTEGSLGILSARILVDEDSFEQAKRIMVEADLGDKINDAGKT